ncbi:MAG: extracellular solute-binding protein [Paracoccaceae bacterium]
MKKLLCSVALLAAGPAFAEGELKVYNWFEYMPQELLDKFEAETGITVTIDTYDSNESMLASLKAGKLGQYDVAVPGDFMVGIMAADGLLDSFTPEEMTNLGNIAPQWMDVPFDPGRTHSIPYQWGSTSFAVNRDVYSGDIATLGMIFDPPDELKGKINMFDSQNEVLVLGSLYLGIPQCTADREQLMALSEMLMNAKQHWASFGSDISKDVLVSGDAAAGMLYSGFSVKARAEGANIEYSYPREGHVLWMDNMVLLKDAPNRDNAIKFMNFLLEPENAAALSNYAAYPNGIAGSEPFLDDSIKTSPENNPPPDATPGVFAQACDQETQQLYDAIWTNLKK